MKQNRHIVIRAFYKLIARPVCGKLISILAKAGDVDLLKVAHHSIGVLKYWNAKVSGERFVTTKLLPRFFNNSSRPPVLFDVGANVGNYSLELAGLYPHARVFAFEPNRSTFEKLTSKTASFGNIECLNYGLGSKQGHLDMYTYENDLISEHASVYEKVLTDLHHSGTLIKRQVPIITIQDFCAERSIDRIDFLKIDTEGFEYEVLLGAQEMIKQKRISAIQFEFNEMNVISRVFLKDFYELLTGYDLYRVDSNRLIPLGAYDSINEIFKFQNILALEHSAYPDFWN